MRSARRALNVLAKTGRSLVSRGPDEAVLAAGALVQRMVGRHLDLPDFDSWQPRTIRDAMSVILQAIEETPYGAPLRFDEPLFVTMSTSQYCPVGCANCYSSSSRHLTDETEDRFLANIRQVAASRTPIVAILGGEPFLHPDLIEGVNALTDAGKSVSIATNWKVSSEQLRKLSDSRLTTLLLSLWGDKTKHDKLRGRGSYDRILANAQAARERGMKSSLLVVISDADTETLDETEALLRRATFDVVQITRKIHVGRQVGTETGARGNLGNLRERTQSLRQHCRQVVIDLPELRPPRKPGRISRLFGIDPFVGCGAGSWLWHIDSRGEGHPCPVGEGAETTKAGSYDKYERTFLETWQSRKLDADKGREGCRFETTM